jgi:hypothetical protein
MKKNERNFLINVMWKPLFAALMTAALSKGTGVDSYIIAVFLGVASAAACYLDYKVFMKKDLPSDNKEIGEKESV